MRQEPVEEIVLKLRGVKNSLMRSYPSAEAWSRDYLNDNLKTLQEFDELLNALTTKHQEEIEKVRSDGYNAGLAEK